MGDLTRAATGGESLSHIVTAALSRYLNKPIHTLFQVSTSGALVAGIYSGAVSSGLILQHGDFGLGTFENLDGADGTRPNRSASARCCRRLRRRWPRHCRIHALGSDHDSQP